MFNFDILGKGLGIVSAAHFVYDFPTEMLHRLYSINYPNFIVWLSLFLEILGNHKLCCDIINFKTNLIFLIKPFLYMTKNIKTKT